MPEWLIERGIGETRSARIEDGRIVEARILVDGIVSAGTELVGRLKRSGRQLIADVEGQEYLLPDGAPGVTEGAELKIEVTREIIPGIESWKRPLARRVSGAANPVDRISGCEQSFPGASNALSDAGWDDLIGEARSGAIYFDGGELHVFPTPAMTLIDVDGTLPADELARLAAFEAARAILRLGIGGSIGIDFPTVAGKAARAQVDLAIDEMLPRPFERTSLNGFGFLQIVRPRRHASVVELAQDRAPFEARALLRQIAFEPAGPKRIVAHPAVVAVLEGRSDWLDALARQVGGPVGLRADPALPMSGGYAEAA
ncbi:MAG TPA: ribonuclease [Sphingomicrobium sp.]